MANRRRSALRELERAAAGVDRVLNHILVVRSYADESDHPRIRDYLDKLGLFGLEWQRLIEDFKEKL